MSSEMVVRSESWVLDRYEETPVSPREGEVVLDVVYDAEETESWARECGLKSYEAVYRIEYTTLARVNEVAASGSVATLADAWPVAA
jgi:hypothetical protein